MYDVWVFLHIAGVLGFVAAHGVSAAVGVKVRGERSTERIASLLELSASTRGLMYGSLVVLLAGGIAAGVEGHWFEQGWIWAALALLIALTVATIPLAVPYYRRIRQELPSATPERLDALLDSTRPIVLAVLGAAILLTILWLMVAKPF